MRLMAQPAVGYSVEQPAERGYFKPAKALLSVAVSGLTVSVAWFRRSFCEYSCEIQFGGHFLAVAFHGELFLIKRPVQLRVLNFYDVVFHPRFVPWSPPGDEMPIIPADCDHRRRNQYGGGMAAVVEYVQRHIRTSVNCDQAEFANQSLLVRKTDATTGKAYESDTRNEDSGEPQGRFQGVRLDEARVGRRLVRIQRSTSVARPAAAIRPWRPDDVRIVGVANDCWASMSLLYHLAAGG
jgi:hypothetical protein